MALDFNAVDFNALDPQFQADANSSIMQSQLGGANQPPLLVLDNGMFVVKKGGKVVQQYEGQSVNVIIHEIPAQNGRVMYPGKYNKAAPPTDPLCWSMDGNTPHVTVPQTQRQSNDCSLCPQNQKGSAGEGDYKNCSSTTQILVSTVNAPDVLLRFNVNGGTAFGDSYPDERFYSFNQYIDFLRSKKLELGRVATALCIDRKTQGANNKTLFAPMAIMEDNDAPWLQHLKFKADMDLPKLVQPFYVMQPSLPGPAQDANLLAPGAAAPAALAPATQPAVQPMAQPQMAPVAAAPAQPMAQPQLEPVAAAPAQTLQEAGVTGLQPVAPVPAAAQPAEVVAAQSAPVAAVPQPGADVAPGSLPPVPEMDMGALTALGAQAAAQPAAATPVQPAAVAPAELAAVPTLAPAAPAVAAVPTAAQAAVPVAAASVTDSTTAALDGLANMDLGSMLQGFANPT